MDNNAPVPRARDWTYLKIYVGHAVDKLDHLILDLLPRVVEEAVTERWFFIRYFDEGGLHLRLRVLPRDGMAALVRRNVEEQANSSLTRLGQAPPGFYRPMMALSTESVSATGQAARGFLSRIDSAQYEPELDKFGDGQCMTIAEQLFQSSSKCAYEIIRAESEGRLSRKTLAPILMNAVLQSIPPSTSTSDFWSQYASYWLGGYAQGANTWRTTFSQKASDLAQRGLPIIPSELRPEEARQVHSWRNALEHAASLYNQVPPGQRPSPDVLAFNLVHLMNNRLGFQPLEEAYLATLLQLRAAERA